MLLLYECRSTDKEQAERIAEAVKFKLSIPELPVKKYSDSKVRPGYIEIWFGKGK